MRLSVGSLWRRILHWRRDKLVAQCDRVSVLTHVHEASRLAPRYLFMIILSAGIASLGLLQNSVAVIIGAMLISPLMAPIVELGMGLATFDLRTVGQSLRTTAAGLVLALATSALIVRLSPIQEATSEILARTSPTLFDLLVAVFSGLAGAHATITRKGETIVGVAIATALMPPIAVVGYGLALEHWDIAQGASFLFLTNLLAIALSVTVVARVYGFGGSDSPKQTLWQGLLIVGTFGILAVPLGIGLKRISEQTQARNAAKSVLDAAASESRGRVTAFRIDQDQSGYRIDAVLTASRHVDGLQQRMRSRLASVLDKDVELNLLEVVSTSDAQIAQQQASLRELRDSIEVLRQDRTHDDAAERTGALQRAAVLERIVGQLGTLTFPSPGVTQLNLDTHPRLSLGAAYELEAGLQAGLEGNERVVIVPALQALPWVPLVEQPAAVESKGSSAVASTEAIKGALRSDALNAALWALQRWDVSHVAVQVDALEVTKDLRLRAEATAQLIRDAGIEVDPITYERSASAEPRLTIQLR